MVNVEADLEEARESPLAQCAETAAGSGEVSPPGFGRIVLRTTAQAGEMAHAEDKRAIRLPVEGMEAAEAQVAVEEDEAQAEASSAWVAAVVAVAAEAEEEAEAEELRVSLSAAAESAVAEALTLENEGKEGDVEVSWLDVAELENDQQQSGSMELSEQMATEVPNSKDPKHYAEAESKLSSEMRAAFPKRLGTLEERRESDAKSSTSILEDAMAVASEAGDQKQNETDAESKASSEMEAAVFERACSSDTRRESDAKSNASILEVAMAVASEAGDQEQHEADAESMASLEMEAAAFERACSSDERIESDSKSSTSILQVAMAVASEAGDQEGDTAPVASSSELEDAVLEDAPVASSSELEDAVLEEKREDAPDSSMADAAEATFLDAVEADETAPEDAATEATHPEALKTATEAPQNDISPDLEPSAHCGDDAQQKKEAECGSPKEDMPEQMEETDKGQKEEIEQASSNDVVTHDPSHVEFWHDSQQLQQKDAATLRHLPDDVMVTGASAAAIKEESEMQQEQDDMWAWMYGCGYLPDQAFEGLHSGVASQAQALKSQEQLSGQQLDDEARVLQSEASEIVAKHVDVNSPDKKDFEQKLSSLQAIHEAQAALLARAESHAQNETSAAEKLKKHYFEEHARAEHAEVASRADVTAREQLRAHLVEERSKCNRWEELAVRSKDGAESQHASVEQAQQRLASAERHAERLESRIQKESAACLQEQEAARKLFSESRHAAAEKNLLAEQELRRAADQQKEMASLEEQCARLGLSEQRAKDEAVQLSQELLKREQEESVRQVHSSRSGWPKRFQFCPGVGSRLSGQREEARMLCAEFEEWTAQAQGREQEAALQTAGVAAQAEQLEAMRHRLQEEEEMMARNALQAAQARLEQDRQVEEAASRREVAAAEHHREEEAVEQRRARMDARERCLIDEGHGSRVSGLLVPDVPLAVRIPNFHAAPRIGGSASYNIIVEGPGATETLQRRYGDFRELHEVLSAKPFASSLQALPQDWILTSFSTMMLERRRRHLEAYLAFLCTHAQVLLDTALWDWLGVDDLTQVVVRLVAARAVQWAAELSRLVETLEAVLAAGGDAHRCVHPAVLGVLQEVLMDFDDEAAQAAACRVLERLLLSSTRARQLFLATPSVSSPLGSNAASLQPRAAGAASLAAVCLNSVTGGPRAAAVATLQHVLEALNSAVADAEARQSAAAAEAEMAAAEVAAATAEGEAAGERRSEERSAAAAREGDAEPGECCVCLDRGKSHALLPCGHLCTCMDCADYLAARGSPCPVCRRPIEQAVQIFI